MRPAVLAEAEPLEAGGQVLDPDAFRRPAQPLAQDHHRGQGHHDRGQAESRDERAVERRPGARRSPTAPSATSGIGTPAFARRPATTPQIANCEPIEMSIWRARITSVMPTAATRTGRVGDQEVAQVGQAEEGRRHVPEEQRAEATAPARPTARGGETPGGA